MNKSRHHGIEQAEGGEANTHAVYDQRSRFIQNNGVHAPKNFQVNAAFYDGTLASRATDSGACRLCPLNKLANSRKKTNHGGE